MTEDLVTVLLVDDHPLVRRGLMAMLDATDGVDVCGTASDGQAAVRRADELQPDVVVMDLHLPELTGVDATREITRRSPHIAVLVLTMIDSDQEVVAALRAGARGYLLKNTEPDDVLRAIHSVARGEAVFGPEVASRVLASFSNRVDVPQVPFPELTGRERQVLDLLAARRSTAAIGRQLDIRPKTVRNHISNILTKLAVMDRTEAVLRAREAGLGRD